MKRNLLPLAWLIAVAFTLCLPTAGRAASESQTPKVVAFAMPTKAIAPLAANYLIPEYLGYYRDSGLSARFTPVGSVSAAMAALADGRADFAALPADGLLQIASKSGAPPITAFYEMTYPFKYGVAVNPSSPLKSIAELRGKTIGVSNFGTSEYVMGQALIRAAGMDPATDVHWLAVGEGVTAGIALKQERIAAYIYWDTGFGQIEAAGIKLRFLPIKDPPDVGGIFICARTQFLKEHPEEAIGIGQAIAKASLFVQTNPRAAAYAYIKEFPSAAPKVASLQKQVDALEIPIKWRMPLYRSKDPALTQWGQISGKEWTETAAFLHLTNLGDLSRFYTNDLIGRVNQFDQAKVVQQAKTAPQ